MAKVEFKINSKGVQELLKSSEMRSVVSSAAESVARSAMGMSKGGIYKATVKTGAKRVYANISAMDIRAYLDNQRNNLLTKALRGARV
jgi:hypothetical protein